MIKKSDRLSNLQYTSLIASTIIGVAVISLPKIAAEASDRGALVSVIICGVLTILFALAMSILGGRFPNKTVIEYSPIIIGRFLGRIFGGLIVLYFIAITGIILRGFSDALKGVLLEKTPLEIIMVTMLLVVCYLVLNGISGIVKISELFLPVIVFSLLIVVGFSLKNFSFIKIRPLLTPPLIPSIEGVPNLMTAFLGYEIILFAIPFMNDYKKAPLYGSLGAGIPAVLYTLLVIAVVGVFGVGTTKQLTFPTITLAKGITFPGAFIERFDIFFVVLWILAAFTSVANFYYMATFSAVRLMGLRNYQPFIFGLLPLIYLVAIIPQNIFQIQGLTAFVGYLGLIISIITLIIMLLAWIMGKKESKNA